MSITCHKRARGSALVIAIFLLVALAALGAFIVSITSSQQIGSAYDIEGARAYQAAHYGNDWGMYQVLKSTDISFLTACRAAPYGAPTTSNLSGLAGSLSSFTVTVSCGAASSVEGGATVWVYQIAANACNQPTTAGACPNTTAATVAGLGYVERRVSLTVAN